MLTQRTTTFVSCACAFAAVAMTFPINGNGKLGGAAIYEKLVSAAYEMTTSLSPLAAQHKECVLPGLAEKKIPVTHDRGDRIQISLEERPLYEIELMFLERGTIYKNPQHSIYGYVFDAPNAPVSVKAVKRYRDSRAIITGCNVEIADKFRGQMREIARLEF